jgi:hypothetical protein
MLRTCIQTSPMSRSIVISDGPERVDRHRAETSAN